MATRKGRGRARRESTVEEPNQQTVLMEQMVEQNRAVIELVQTSKSELRKEMQEIKERLGGDIQVLTGAVKINSIDIRRLTEEVRKNSEDIRKNSEDIRVLTERTSSFERALSGLVGVE